MNCTWPIWLDRSFREVVPEKDVHIFTHPTYGQVYALGPSKDFWHGKNMSSTLSWYDKDGQWITMDRQIIPLSSKNDYPSNIEEYQARCKMMPAHCADIKYDNITELLGPEAKVKVRERELWWDSVELTKCRPKPKRCRIPEFITPSWIGKNFGFAGSKLSITKYLHSKLGTIYTVVDINMADSPTRWYDNMGNFIHSSYVPGWDHPTTKQMEEEKIWSKSVKWQGVCE